MKAASLPYMVVAVTWVDGSCSYKVVDRADRTPVSRFYPTRIGAQRECNRRNREAIGSITKVYNHQNKED